MPLPLKPGYNFNFEHYYRPPYFEMTAAEAYTDFYALSYILSGENLIYSTNYTAIIRAGDISFTPKNMYFRSSYISDTPREGILLKFTDIVISDLLEVIGYKNFNEFCEAYPMIHLNKSTQNKILSILNEMEREWNSYNEYSELLLKGLLNKVIITCIKECSVSQIPTLDFEKNHVCLAAAIQYINIHLRESPSLEETAQHVHISASHLSKIFINHLHTPFSTFVSNEKIMYAQKLLVDSTLDMNEIATESGFSSSAYFSYCFKRATGLSPLQFRKINRQ